MTTNKPEVEVDEMIEAVQRICETAMGQTLVARIPECGEFGGIAQDADWPLNTIVELATAHHRCSEYSKELAALQAELEQWKNGSTIRDEQNEELHQYVLELKTEIEKLRTALAESRANDRQAMYYLNQVREIVGGDDFPDMVERCRELVK